MKEKIRILYINGGTMDRGGISIYMMNYYRQFDKSKLQIDFIVHGKEDDFDEEILKSGGKIYYLPEKKKNIIKWYVTMCSILKNGRYDIVHSHMDGMNGLVLPMAKKYNIPIRISHSHNTEHLTNNLIKKKLHDYFKHQILKSATNMWGCSTNAIRWLYGRVEGCEVIPNAINIDKYFFDEQKRVELRKKIGIENQYVIGHVGRLDYQKNQEFLIEIFDQIVQKDGEVILLLVGAGADKEKIETMIKVKKIQDKVKLLGKCDNVSELMNVFDVFVFPSRFEGLGISVVEAQCNGLYCICSDNVPKDVILTENIDFLSLEDSSKWIGMLEKKPQRNIIDVQNLLNSIYNIEVAAKRVQDKYIQLSREI